MVRKMDTPKPTISGRLANHVLDLVFNRPKHVTLEQIARATGVSVYWLSEFARGRFDNPGAARLELLYKFFHGKDIEL